MSGLVSVIIPTYNRGKSIIKAIESVRNQTYNNIEICVIDDASTDGTEDIIKSKYRNESKIVYYKLEKNSGACVARNIGISISKGEYIAFLDSDDTFLPPKIELQMLELKRSQADICVSNYKYIDKNKNEKIIRIDPKEGKQLYDSLLYCNTITTGSILGKKKCFEHIKFDECLSRYQDWDLVLRLSQTYEFCYVEKVLLEQQFQFISITSSTSHKKTQVALERLYEKNKIGFEECHEAFVQINWLKGLHSIFTEEKTLYKSLWIGVSGNGFKIRRFCVLILAAINCKSVIEKCYSMI